MQCRLTACYQQRAACYRHIHAHNLQVFGANNFPGFEDSPFIQQLEADYAAAVGRDSGKKLEEALTNKARVRGSAVTACALPRTVYDLPLTELWALC